MNSLLDEDLAHKQIPGPSIEISALDIGSMQPSQASLVPGPESVRDYPSSALTVTTYLPGEGPPPPPLPHPHHGGTLGRTLPPSQVPGSTTLPPHHPLSSTSLSGTMQCKHRAPNGGLFRQSPGKTPMPIAEIKRCLSTTHQCKRLPMMHCCRDIVVLDTYCYAPLYQTYIQYTFRRIGPK
ncbi:hypothetical protein GOODEAATRI_003176 [Goodea atripinnis]|uniref:Uncharacterized protein n=1 Tax=Goodea atripinnis TaxID=208336 RepID=A0ABV0PUY5_9TELE